MDDKNLPLGLLLASLRPDDSHPDLDVDQVRWPKHYCTNCGVKIFPQPEPHRTEEALLCPQCQNVNLLADRYCGGCGLRLVAPVSEPVIAAG